MPIFNEPLSIVIPLHNEQHCIEFVVVEWANRLTEFGDKWELLLINDGSTDSTANVIRIALSKLSSDLARRVVCIDLEHRMGQSEALYRGLQSASGDFIVVCDGDGQYDPSDLQSLLIALKDSDAAMGQRIIRADRLGKRLFSKLANIGRRLLTRSKIIDSGCSFIAFRRYCIDYLFPVQSLHRFLGVTLEAAGLRVKLVSVRHKKRIGGSSKYGNIERAAYPALDCLSICWLSRRRLGKAKSEVSVEKLQSVGEHV